MGWVGWPARLMGFCVMECESSFITCDSDCILNTGPVTSEILTKDLLKKRQGLRHQYSQFLSARRTVPDQKQGARHAAVYRLPCLTLPFKPPNARLHPISSTSRQTTEP